MSYVIADPQMMTSAASDLATIASNDVNAAHMVAAAKTTAVLPAAADEVSAGIAALFSAHAANYQATAAQAAAFNDQFVQHLTASAASFAHAEAANTAAFSLTADAPPPSELPSQLWNTLNSVPPLQALGFLLFLPIEIPYLFFADSFDSFAYGVFQVPPA